MFGGGGGNFGFHSDVLAAEPADAEAVGRLTLELKSRAVASIKQGNFPEAKALYTKAININSTETVTGLPDNANTLAILLANRSMCSLKMTLSSEALDDANAAIDKDASYIKGYYRKGVAMLALGDSSGARAAFSQGLVVKPDDKELLDQLSKVASVLENPSSSSAKSGGGGSGSSSSSASSASVPSSKKAAPPAAEEPDDEADGGPAIRGYKVKADGTKTTFFNHDLSEEAKALIGDIAPKKLAEVPALPTSASGTGSAWNAAGTHETVNVTKWATDRLKAMLESVSVQTPSGDGLLVIDSAVVSGDAEIVSNRGKVKRICDLSVAVKFTLSGPGAESVKGSMDVSDVTADDDFEISDVKLDGTTTPSLQTMFSQHVKTSSGCFHKSVSASLRAFCAEFRAKTS